MQISTLKAICDIYILVNGVTTTVLISSKSHSLKKWGYVTALLGQPAWLYVTYGMENKGMFLLSVFYTAMWIRGIKNNWNKKETD